MTKASKPTIAMVLAILLLPSCTSTATADESGIVTLWCKGSAQVNDDPLGREESVRNIQELGPVVIDLDTQTLQFMNSRQKVPLLSVSTLEIIGGEPIDWNGDSEGSVVRLNRATGETYVRFSVHDSQQQVTWHSHTFEGTCFGPRP
jgi:hypothetical protein